MLIFCLLAMPKQSVVVFSREFTHRVKSVSMAKFTSKEVEELQRGGNQVGIIVIYMVFISFSRILFVSHMIYFFQRARENFLKGFDMQQNQGFPNCRYVDGGSPPCIGLGCFFSIDVLIPC